MRGYQPMLAVWAETGLVLADQFRDGNVPAQMEPRKVAQRAFAALPSTVKEYYYRGDSACHESTLVNWLRDEQRADGPRGRIGFAISTRMSEALHAAMRVVPEAAWETYGESHPAEIRECADVPFVPGEKTEKKDSQPLRYVAIRIRRKQGELFADGSTVRHFAVLSNRWELKPALLIEWHREKAGTIELVHDVIKNDLGGGVLPSKYFGANAAWLRLAVIAHNVLQALKRLALPAPKGRADPRIFQPPFPHSLRRVFMLSLHNLRGPPAASSRPKGTAHALLLSLPSIHSLLTHPDFPKLLRYRRIGAASLRHFSSSQYFFAPWLVFS